MHGTTPVGKCKVPCHSTRFDKQNYHFKKLPICRYKLEQLGIEESNELFGLAIVFDTSVEQTKSDWQITEVTLLTRIGGIIGVGKNLLWIIVFVGSSIIFVSKFVNYF